MSAVFKTPFVRDLPFCGVWNSAEGASATIDEGTPVDGYSEVILVPGSTECYFHTLGIEAIPWTTTDANDAIVSHNMLMIPVLSSHPVDTDVVAGRTQLAQGLKTYNTPGASSVACLPKLDDAGHFIYEATLTPVGVLADDIVTLLLGWYNKGIDATVRTIAHVTVQWDSGPIEVADVEISSAGSAVAGAQGLFSFTFTVPANNDFIISFFVEVDDNDQASLWKFSMAAVGADGYGFLLPARSACAFAVIDAPEMGDLSETLSERTSALTGLLTYMGSTLQDGGQIAAARLGMGLSPLRAPQGDVYTYLASLPFYNADYALREGIFGWWLPDSIQEHFYVPYRNPRSDDLDEDAVLQFALLRDNPNQAVRLKVVQNLEVITRSRLYSAKAGPNNPAYAVVIGAVKAIPAITINRKHIGILGRAFNAVKGWMSKPANWSKLLKQGASVIERLVPT
jgi:hypothetical protein